MANLVSSETFNKMIEVGWKGPRPDAQEIADQLFKERVAKLKWRLDGGGDSLYISCDELGGYGMGIHADTIVEALAALWLKLQEAKR